VVNKLLSLDHSQFVTVMHMLMC